MPHIRPVTELRNNFADISRIVHETSEPVFLTKNGYGDMVVMSIEAYEKKLFESEVYFKLKEAEIEARTTKKRYSREEVFSDLRAKLASKVNGDSVYDKLYKKFRTNMCIEYQENKDEMIYYFTYKGARKWIG